MIKIALIYVTMITGLLNSSWTTVTDEYYNAYGSVKSVYTYRADESINTCVLKSVSEEVDENGVVWTVYHYGSESID